MNVHRLGRGFFGPLALLWSTLSIAVAADPLDWPHWRGPEMNGISREKGIVGTWSLEGENLLWRKPEYGTRSTPIVMNGKLYELCRHNPESTKEGEKVVCLDAATGEKIWENAFNVFLTDAPSDRVGWSCVVGDPESGNVFALGLCDFFQCLDGKTGKTHWSRSMSEEYGMIHTYGGRTNMPMVFEDLVIISGVMTGWGEYAVPAHRFVAFDKNNGQAVWITSTRLRPKDTTYSSPVLANFNGQRAIVFGSGDGSVYALQPRTGKVIWTYDASLKGINTTPLVVGNTVYCGFGEESFADHRVTGGLFAVDGTGTSNVTKTKELWSLPGKAIARAAPILVDDRLYAIDEVATMWIVDPADGKVIGQQRFGGRSMFASPLYADGKIFVSEVNGLFITLEPTEKGVKIVNRVKLPDEMLQGSPIISHGRLYIPTNGALYCIGNKDQVPAADPIPTPLPELRAAADGPPAQLQVVPVESILRPGQKQPFKIRLYDANGRYLDAATTAAAATFELQGRGKLEGNDYFATAEAGNTASVVTAKFAGLTATARIRTIPPLPWSFDFNDGQVPPVWIGAAYRHIVIDEDYLNALTAKNPMAARLYIYLMTAFVNGGNPPTVKFQDLGVRSLWTDFLRYFSLDGDGKPQSIDDAKKVFDAGLEVLKADEFLAKWDWSQDASGTLELTAARGPRKITGNGMLCKISTIPLGTRSQGWMGPTDLHDYTIQADLKGTTRNQKLPAMGLVNQRYTLDLIGVSQELQIRSWTSQLDLRFAKTIPFAWKPDMWYTMKFQSENKDGKAILRGKVWPRGEKEPAEWTTEAADETPNVTGSPGFFGNATDSEVFIDNVKVTPGG